MRSPTPAMTPPATSQTPVLQAREFEQFRKLAYEKFGLNLTDAKHELVATRLGKKLRGTCSMQGVPTCKFAATVAGE